MKQEIEFTKQTIEIMSQIEITIRIYKNEIPRT